MWFFINTFKFNYLKLMYIMINYEMFDFLTHHLAIMVLSIIDL